MSVSVTEGTSLEPPVVGVIRAVLFAVAVFAVIGVSVGLSSAHDDRAASFDASSAALP